MRTFVSIFIAVWLLLDMSGADGVAYGRVSRRLPDTSVFDEPDRFSIPAELTPSLLHDSYFVFDGDTLFAYLIPNIDELHSGPLTDADYYEIADSLGVEAAAIKAVVEIETGGNHTGFAENGRPLVNFDLGLFRTRAARRGVALGAAQAVHPETFSPPDIARYGTHQKAHQARLDGAMEIDSVAAIESTFWGMFQIAGFNWKLAGASSREDFVRRMGRSEYDQLVLFANFMRQTGLVEHLRTKNWRTFARLYNGPSYAARGYHTRLSRAYERNRRTMPARM